MACSSLNSFSIKFAKTPTSMVEVNPKVYEPTLRSHLQLWPITALIRRRCKKKWVQGGESEILKVGILTTTWNIWIAKRDGEGCYRGGLFSIFINVTFFEIIFFPKRRITLNQLLLKPFENGQYLEFKVKFYHHAKALLFKIKFLKRYMDILIYKMTIY